MFTEAHHDFTHAIRKNLILEIANRTPNPPEILERPRLRNAANGRVVSTFDSGEKRKELHWNEAKEKVFRSVRVEHLTDKDLMLSLLKDESEILISRRWTSRFSVLF